MQVGAQIHTAAPEVPVKVRSVSIEQDCEWFSKQPNVSKKRRISCYNRESKHKPSMVQSVVQSVRRPKKNRPFLLLVNLFLFVIFVA
jgi:hypothetical protein